MVLLTVGASIAGLLSENSRTGGASHESHATRGSRAVVGPATDERETKAGVLEAVLEGHAPGACGASGASSGWEVVTTHTRRPVTDRRPCQKPRKDWSMVALGIACFVASGPVIYAGAVAALELGALMGAFGFGLAGAFFVAGLVCIGEVKEAS